MAEKGCVLVLGLDELASAVSRRLLLGGYAVAMHAAAPPVVLRRRMAFSDAWHDGAATLAGVEARRIHSDTEFLAGLRGSMFVPVLAQRSLRAIARWPWEVLVDARQPPVPTDWEELVPDLSIVLGPGAEAGSDCDIVIETGGNDPGAVIRNGSARTTAAAEHECLVPAPADGLFHAEAEIGDLVAPGDMLGFVGAVPLVASVAGRLCGLLRSGQSVRLGDAAAEIAASRSAPVDAIRRKHRTIARSVEFTIDMESQGGSGEIWTPRTGFRRPT
ncbi:MAG TPA: hypothetical protein VFY92_06585 [Hyphomicrobiaceae bacterium]|nr:hypothetical protein [Hyphomicrobiaceae bacterium]